MKKTDIILLSVIALFAIFGMLYVNKIQKDSILTDGIAFVIYRNEPILEISLEDGSYIIIKDQFVYSVDETNNIYVVEGDNGPVTIEHGIKGVRVIDETSPENICQQQGWTASPLKPLTCLPNNLIIVIMDPNIPDDIDGVIK